MKKIFFIACAAFLVFAMNLSVANATILNYSFPYSGTGTAGLASCGAPQAITLPTNSANLTASLSNTSGFIYSYWNLQSFTDVNGVSQTPPTLSWQNRNPTSWPSTTVVSGMTSAGTYNFSFTAVKSDGTNATCATYVAVDAAVPVPDLVVGDVTQSSAIVGTPISLSAPVTNQGTDTTGVAFYTYFQVATGAGGTGTITDINAVNAYGPLAAGAPSLTVSSPNYTFSSIGTYYARACTDKKFTGYPGDVDEDPNGNTGGEANNCSPTWRSIDVGSGVGPVSVTLYANSLANDITITKGQTVTLTWSSTNASSCSNNFSGSTAVSSSTGVTLSPTSSTTYTITCTNSGGSANSSRIVTVITYQCSDGLDNDSDGKTDYPADPGCTSTTDDNETDVSTYQCSNGIDDDGDGKVDYTGGIIGGVTYPADPGCKSNNDNDERDPKDIFFWER